jgi:hypothetical protein
MGGMIQVKKFRIDRQNLCQGVGSRLPEISQSACVDFGGQRQQSAVDAEDVDHSLHVVGEHLQAHFGFDHFEGFGEERQPSQGSRLANTLYHRSDQRRGPATTLTLISRNGNIRCNLKCHIWGYCGEYSADHFECQSVY